MLYVESNKLIEIEKCLMDGWLVGWMEGWIAFQMNASNTFQGDHW
jgi:hypothetical protein